MGFIDYHGTKEDRYQEVLEYAHAQQEEERRRNCEIRVADWLQDAIGDNRFAKMNLNELLKYIIVRYQNLEAIRRKFILLDIEDKIDTDVLWNDFFLYTVFRRIRPLSLPLEQKNKYIQTFAEKVFKLPKCDYAVNFCDEMNENKQYRTYFETAFDLKNSSSYQFYRFLHEVSDELSFDEDVFYKYYKDLNVLLSIYMFQAFYPKNDVWMQELQGELAVIDKIWQNSSNDRLKATDYKTLNNPLYGVKTILSESGMERKTGFMQVLDKEIFDSLLEKGDIPAYIKACKMLLICELTQEMRCIYEQLLERLPVLQETANRYKDVYEPDLEIFYEYYIPEALKVTLTYLEYDTVKMSAGIIENLRLDVMHALKTLLVAINDKIDEIYRYVSIEEKANAKALDAMMAQDGYVESAFKISNRRTE